MVSYCELEQVPEILKNEVKEFLQDRKTAKLLGVEVIEFTPYKDKSIKETRYTAYIEDISLVATLTFDECSKPEWSSKKVEINKMFLSNVDFFLSNSSMFTKFLKRHEIFQVF